MSDTTYGVAYTVEPPVKEFMPGDTVKVIEADVLRLQWIGRAGAVELNPNPANGFVRVSFGKKDLSVDFRPEWLRKIGESESKLTVNQKVARFKAIVDEMVATYEKKNHDYGDGFGISVRKYGLIAALTRMSDKFNRIENLILGAENKVPDESIMDSLKDLACYAVMTVMAIEDNNFGKVQ